MAAILLGMNTAATAPGVQEGLHSDACGGCDGTLLLWAKGVLEFPGSEKLPEVRLHTSYLNVSSTVLSAGILAIDNSI